MQAYFSQGYKLTCAYLETGEEGFLHHSRGDIGAPWMLLLLLLVLLSVVLLLSASGGSGGRILDEHFPGFHLQHGNTLAIVTKQ